MAAPQRLFRFVDSPARRVAGVDATYGRHLAYRACRRYVMRFSVVSGAGLALAVGIGACGSTNDNNAGGDSGGASAFVGTWACSSPTGGGAATIAAVEDSDGSIRATLTGDSGPNCALKFMVSGNTATAESGQSCTVGGSTVTVTAGTAKISGTSLTANFTFSEGGVSAPIVYDCTQQ
jgi:hypothetical protein